MGPSRTGALIEVKMGPNRGKSASLIFVWCLEFREFRGTQSPGTPFPRNSGIRVTIRAHPRNPRSEQIDRGLRGWARILEKRMKDDLIHRELGVGLS